jgi:N-acetyl-alpha-D-glucosaminyl L-malate synthase BshA
MRIAITIPLFPPKWLAGTEIATYNIAKHLARRGHEVHVITALDKGLPEESTEEGFYVHRIFWQKIRFVGVISFWTKVFLILRKVNPDMIHAQSIGICIPALIAKKLLRKPYVVWGQGSDVYLPGKFIKSISKLVLKNADTVIALTEDMKSEMQKFCDRAILVIPNGIDSESFENLSRESIRKKLKIKEDENVITFVGTLRPVKGVKYLIRAIKLITKVNGNVKLMLVGDGEEREYVEDLVEELDLNECVKFIGRVQNEEVPEYMVASDIFVLPSLSESFGIVNLEAMASGLPIVATKVGGLPEIVKDGENGFLVEPKNPKQIAEGTLLLLRDNELRERISKNNKEKAKKYGWDGVVERLEEAYQNHL